MSTHGGKRPGAGRPTIDGEDPTESHNLTAPSTVWRLLERLGDGNRSAGLRKLAERFKQDE